MPPSLLCTDTIYSLGGSTVTSTHRLHIPIYTGMADLSDTSRWWFNCVSVSEWVCVSEDMLPYCSAHDEWLIMKLCMHVGYHDANNVSTFGGDSVTQLNNLSFCIPKYMRGAGYHEKIIGRTYFGGDQVTLELDLVLYNTIKWPYQPKHSPRILNATYIYIYIYILVSSFDTALLLSRLGKTTRHIYIYILVSSFDTALLLSKLGKTTRHIYIYILVSSFDTALLLSKLGKTTRHIYIYILVSSFDTALLLSKLGKTTRHIYIYIYSQLLRHGTVTLQTGKTTRHIYIYILVSSFDTALLLSKLGKTMRHIYIYIYIVSSFDTALLLSKLGKTMRHIYIYIYIY